MRTIIVSFLLLILFTFQIMSQEIYSDAYTNSLWNNTVKPYLAEPLWKTEYSYNAGHFLMVPMYVAFEKNNTEWKKDLAKQFQSYADSGYNDMGKTLLYRIQYIYLASEYINLCKRYGEDSLIPPNLYNILFDKINTTWNKDNIWAWQHPKYKKNSFKNMRTKVMWKLYNNTIKEKTYHTAITDDEFFVMATASNLKYFLTQNNQPVNSVLDDIYQLGVEAFRVRVIFNQEGGWLIQPGYWTNHNDYLYAGNDTIADNIIQIMVPNIGEDFSHSFRYPCWINSFLKASEQGSTTHDFFIKLKAGLSIQIFNSVIQLTSDSTKKYIAKNYMDGTNGVYRYQYSGRKGGIGPYELTHSIQIGWWSFLDCTKSKEMYSYFAEREYKEFESKANVIKNIKADEFKHLISILASMREALYD